MNTNLAADEAFEEVDQPPSIELVINKFLPQFLSLPMFTAFDRCPDGVVPTKSFLCELGATANNSKGDDLTSTILACPPAACLEFACPGHEFATKGLQG